MFGARVSEAGSKGLSSSARGAKERQEDFQERIEREEEDVRGDAGTAVYDLKICDERYRVVANSYAQDIRPDKARQMKRNTILRGVYLGIRSAKMHGKGHDRDLEVDF